MIKMMKTKRICKNCDSFGANLDRKIDEWCWSGLMSTKSNSNCICWSENTEEEL